jgi:HD-GYP domain-containing protein (c-di-GMP phosphodiesterase class II)
VIDWFPTTDSCDARHDLVLWQGEITMRRVARAIDARDPATAGHSDRVAELAGRIAREVGWGRRSVARMQEAGAIHDIGKVCLPAAILLTPGTLSPDEYEIVKTHAAIGAQIAATVLSPRQVGWIRHHHERWDGRGYPDSLAGGEIPEGAAILSLADAWDAMTSRSWSRPALSAGQAMDECAAEAGRQFAPWAVAALERVIGVADPAPRRAPALRLIPAA